MNDLVTSENEKVVEVPPSKRLKVLGIVGIAFLIVGAAVGFVIMGVGGWTYFSFLLAVNILLAIGILWMCIFMLVKKLDERAFNTALNTMEQNSRKGSKHKEKKIPQN